MLLYVLSFMSKVFCKIRLVRHMANQTDDYHNGKCNHNAADFTKALSPCGRIAFRYTNCVYLPQTFLPPSLCSSMDKLGLSGHTRQLLLLLHLSCF